MIAALARLAFVKAAQAAGLTLTEIRQIIAAREQDGAPCGRAVALLDAHAAELDRRIAGLPALREQVFALNAVGRRTRRPRLRRGG
jgi:MerR family copper efflux transcriptional regulator